MDVAGSVVGGWALGCVGGLGRRECGWFGFGYLFFGFITSARYFSEKGLATNPLRLMSMLSCSPTVVAQSVLRFAMKFS